MSLRWRRIAAYTLLFAGALSGCNFPESAAVPSPDPATLAARTVAVILTQAASQTQAAASRPTDDGASPTPTARANPSTPGPAGACSNAATFIDDVTVRDNTELLPQAEFVKVWRLENAGSCTWSQSYTLAFFGGDRMDAPPVVPLMTVVSPGSRVDLAVDLVAPPTPGTYQGFWKMRDADGEYFGIGPAGDQSFWVKIIVAEAPKTTTPSPNQTNTPVPTPAVHAQGSTELAASSSLDLDNGSLNPASGGDLRYDLPSAGMHSLVPLGGAKAGSYTPSPGPPSPSACQATPLSSDPLPAVSLTPGALICYLTGEGRFGFLRITTVDPAFKLTFTTWAP